MHCQGWSQGPQLSELWSHNSIFAGTGAHMPERYRSPLQDHLEAPVPSIGTSGDVMPSSDRVGHI